MRGVEVKDRASTGPESAGRTWNDKMVGQGRVGVSTPPVGLFMFPQKPSKI